MTWQLLLTLNSPSQAYKYKGAALCFTILLRALSGNYVNFGVFELYGDPCLNDALDVTLRLALSIPLSHLMVYQKVARAYFQLVEVLSHNHTAFLITRDGATFTHIGTSLETGLKSLDVSISSQCAGSPFFLWSGITSEPPPAITPKISYTERSKLSAARLKTLSLAVTPKRSFMSMQVFEPLECSIITPFGLPVLPEVNIMYARSLKST